MPILAKYTNRVRQGRKRRKLRNIALLPSLLTLGNLVCGFAGIYFAMRAALDSGAGVDAATELTLQSVRIERILPSFLSIGAGLLLLGMVFDMFDGMIARLTRNTSSFGGQLDSLADMVTSGVAPMTLMLVFMMKEFQEINIYLSPLSEHTVGRFAWVTAVVYVACAAVRLARFNVECAENRHDHTRFRGLPTPGAALVVVSYLIWIEQANMLGLEIPVEIAIYSLPSTAVIAGLLMVSSLPYSKIGSVLRGKKPFSVLVAVIFVFGLFWIAKSVALLLGAVVYALSGPTLALILAIRGKPKPNTQTTNKQVNEERGIA